MRRFSSAIVTTIVIASTLAACNAIVGVREVEVSGPDAGEAGDSPNDAPGRDDGAVEADADAGPGLDADAAADGFDAGPLPETDLPAAAVPAGGACEDPLRAGFQSGLLPHFRYLRPAGSKAEANADATTPGAVLSNGGAVISDRAFDPKLGKLRVFGLWKVGSAADSLTVLTRSSGKPSFGEPWRALGVGCRISTTGSIDIEGVGVVVSSATPGTIGGLQSETVSFDVTDDGATVECVVTRSGNAGATSRAAATGTSAFAVAPNRVTFQNARSALSTSTLQHVHVEHGGGDRPSDQWEFDDAAGSFTDLTGSSPGVLQPGAARGPGRNGLAMQTTGAADSYVSFGKAPLAVGKSDFAITFWYRGSTAAGYVDVFGNRGGYAGGGKFVSIRGGVSQLSAELYDNQAVQGKVDPVGNGLPANAWFHVAFTREGLTGSLFVNGGQVSTKTAADGVVVDLKEGVVGEPLQETWAGRISAATARFAGDLDSLRIYRRTLSPCERQILAKP